MGGISKSGFGILRIDSFGISNISIRRFIIFYYMCLFWVLISFRRKLSSFIRARRVLDISEEFIKGRLSSICGDWEVW